MNRPFTSFHVDALSRTRGSQEAPDAEYSIESGLFAKLEAFGYAASAVLVALYWSVFWSLNGLDKFLYRTDLGLVTWYGKDRSGQFAGYFTNLRLPAELIDGLLRYVGIWELIVTLPFLAALAAVLRGEFSARYTAFLRSGLLLSAMTFIAFSGFDVIAGDRAELREHGLYLMLVLVSGVVISVVYPGKSKAF